MFDFRLDGASCDQVAVHSGWANPFLMSGHE